VEQEGVQKLDCKSSTYNVQNSSATNILGGISFHGRQLNRLDSIYALICSILSYFRSMDLVITDESKRDNILTVNMCHTSCQVQEFKRIIGCMFTS
jgi:hypothetical protein